MRVGAVGQTAYSTATLGTRVVQRVGLGCMGMSFSYARDPASDDPQDVLEAALGSGSAHAAVLVDTADVYGPFTNERLVGQVLGGHEHAEVVLASKGGLVATGLGNGTRVDGSPAHLRTAVDQTLRRLRVERVDVYFLHRVDPTVPLEESWGTLADLVRAGKVGGLGLSEVDVGQLASAHAIHPVAAVQSELSLFRRAQLHDVVPWCEQRGVAFVAYAPLGRGFLTGAITSARDIGADDFRRRLPRFSSAAVQQNQSLLVGLRAVARGRGATAGQVALAWLLEQSPSIIAIPGTRRVARLHENLAAGFLRLTEDELCTLTRTPEPEQPRYAADRA